jgi:dTDP-glucose 4,6-dehydratase
MSKFVVLGSNAFSGQDFVDLLLDNPSRQVIGISRSKERPEFLLRYKLRKNLEHYTFRQFDMNDDIDPLLSYLDSEKPDYIVNFAAQSEVGPSWIHPEHWFQTNTVALAKLVNHLRQVDYLQRYLHISSPEVYGNCMGTVLEDAPLNPSTPYAASKAAADMLLEVYRKQYGFPLVSVRATNVYGARQQLFKIALRTMIYLKLGRTIQLHGGGTAVKSYIHIRDVSRGELTVLEEGKIGELYHLSPDNGILVKDIVKMICGKMGKDFSACVKTVDERPGQDAAYVIDSTKARDALGWSPDISLEQGIADAISWVDENWPSIQDYPIDYIHKA